MKKMCLTLIACVIVLAACEENIDQPGTGTGTGVNSGIFGVWTGNYGTGNTGVLALNIASSKTWTLAFTDPNGSSNLFSGSWSGSGNSVQLNSYSSPGTGSATLSDGKVLLNQNFSTSYGRPVTSTLTKDGSGNNGTTTKTTLTINNISGYNLSNVEYASVNFGNINSGRDVTKDVTVGTRFIFFYLQTVNGNVQCRTEDILTCEENKQNAATIGNNTPITLVSGDKRGTLKNIFDELNVEVKTTLTIRNDSFIGLTDIRWNNIPITEGQNSVRTGTSVTKDVTAGFGFIYFKREGNPIAVRTSVQITITENEEKIFIFDADVLVAEVSNPGNTDTLGTFFSKPWIYVRQDTNVISLYAEYDFGGLLPDNNKDITFTIENIGGANLVLENVNGNRVNLGENAAGYFSIIQQPLAATVAPGNTTAFTIRFSPAVIGSNFSASVNINTNSQNAEEFVFRVKGNGRDYIYGDTGPGGGMIFYVESGQYKECSGELGTYNWSDAMQTAQNYKGGGFTNWSLPDRGELSLMYQNLHRRNMGGFLNTFYWSSTEYSDFSAYNTNFSTGSQNTETKSNANRVRAVRSFTQ